MKRKVYCRKRDLVRNKRLDIAHCIVAS